MTQNREREKARVTRGAGFEETPNATSHIRSRVAAVGSAFYGLCLAGLTTFVGANRPECDYGKGVQAAAEWMNGARNGPGCRLFGGA